MPSSPSSPGPTRPRTVAPPKKKSAMSSRVRKAPMRPVLQRERRQTLLAEHAVDGAGEPVAATERLVAELERAVRGRRRAGDRGRLAGRLVLGAHPGEGLTQADARAQPQLERLLEAVQADVGGVGADQDRRRRGVDEHDAGVELLDDRDAADLRADGARRQEQAALLDGAVDVVDEGAEVKAGALGCEVDGGLEGEARLGHDLGDRLAGGDGARVRGRADLAVEPGDVVRRHLEAGAGEADGPEVGDARGAEATAHRAGHAHRGAQGVDRADPEREVRERGVRVRPQRLAVDQWACRRRAPRRRRRSRAGRP